MSDELQSIQKGSTVVFTIEKLAFGGNGIGRVNGMVVFVRGALPGQKVEALITKKRKGYAEAKMLKTLIPSPNAVEPQCKHFGECGGCLFQNLDYKVQLSAKAEQVRESLAHIGGFDAEAIVLPAIESPAQYHYRNKMEYSFGRQRWVTSDEIKLDNLDKPKDFALGLHVRGRYDKVLDIDECHLQSSQSALVLHFVRQFALKSEFPVYSTIDHTGFWRNLVIREGKKTGQVLLNVVTSQVEGGVELIQTLGKQLAQQFPEITTMTHNINSRKGQTAVGEVEQVVFGPGVIQDKIGDRIYQISANSFFQTNTLAAEKLYQQVVDLASFGGDELVYDLYAGAGTISIYISALVKEVVGFELITDAIKDAQLNCGLNEVINCHFVHGDVRRELHAENALKKWGRPDVVIIDPPRAGMHEDVIRQIVSLKPQKIVYISCNPATFARDCKILCDNQFNLAKVQPVDMFPMTPHIELVGLLMRS